MKLDNIKRVTQVMRVLSKHGLAGVLTKYGFGRYLSVFKRKEGKIPADFPERLRKSMEELGGAYIKLGQLLSLRPDLIPQEYCDEFSKLLDQVPPEGISVVKRAIQQEFDKPVNDLFRYIDPRPLGSASVGQVHKARLRNGKAVAVKVQRPDIEKQFSADISIIRFIAQKINGKVEGVNLPLIIDEFERYTREELDFNIEAAHIDNIRDSITSSKIVIPEVFWSHTSKKVLTMEYLDGLKLSENSKITRPQAAKTLIDSLVEQIFQRGVFHADLHPGNILLLKNNKLGLLDFGIVGHLDKRTRESGIQIYLAIIERDTNKIAETLIKYGTVSSKTNLNEFNMDVGELVNKWWDRNPEKRQISSLMHRLFVLCSKHNILLSRDTILLGKAMVTAESTARLMDPGFNFVEYSQQKIEELLVEQKQPRKILERFKDKSKEFVSALSELPTRTLEAIDKIKEGTVTLNLDDTKFRHVGEDINRSSNRLSYSLVSAALIIGAAMMMDVGPRVGAYSIISVISLMVATIFVFALFMSIAKEHIPRYDPH